MITAEDHSFSNAVGSVDFGEFTPGNTSFLVMNPDFHFVLAMDVIVCTAGVGNVLRTIVCVNPTVFEPEV